MFDIHKWSRHRHKKAFRPRPVSTKVCFAEVCGIPHMVKFLLPQMLLKPVFSHFCSTPWYLIRRELKAGSDGFLSESTSLFGFETMPFTRKSCNVRRGVTPTDVSLRHPVRHFLYSFHFETDRQQRSEFCISETQGARNEPHFSCFNRIHEWGL